MMMMMMMMMMMIFSKNTQISNRIKVRLVEAQSLHADRRTMDTRKLTDAFRHVAKAAFYVCKR